MSGHVDIEDVSYGRLQAVSSAAAGIIVGTAAGAFSVVVQGLWPLGFLIAFFVLQLAGAARVDRRLLRMRRLWAMPVFALTTGVIATRIPVDWAPVALVGAIFGWVLWFVVYAIVEVRVDPSGRHEGGWR